MQNLDKPRTNMQEIKYHDKKYVKEITSVSRDSFSFLEVNYFMDLSTSIVWKIDFALM